MKRGHILTGAAVVALAVPVTVAARGVDDLFFQGVPSNPQETVWGIAEEVSTNSDGWQPVPEIRQGTDLTLNITPPNPLYLSVDLNEGKAQFRIVDSTGDTVIPNSVFFSGKGVSTATFVTLDDGLDDPIIEWKRKGNDRVEAASVIASTSGEHD